MWNLLKRFVLIIMCVKTATKLLKKNYSSLLYKSSFSWETTETLSDLKQQKCQWIHQKLFLSPVKWIMRAKKTDLNDNTEFLFKLADGHCVLRLLVWSATVKNNYKRATLLHIYLMCNGNDWQSGGREDSIEWREELGTKENDTGEGFSSAVTITMAGWSCCPRRS